MVIKAKEAPRTENASEIMQSVPVRIEMGTVVPVRMDYLSPSVYIISRLRNSIARIEAAHSHFRDTHSAAGMRTRQRGGKRSP